MEKWYHNKNMHVICYKGRPCRCMNILYLIAIVTSLTYYQLYTFRLLMTQFNKEKERRRWCGRYREFNRSWCLFQCSLCSNWMKEWDKWETKEVFENLGVELKMEWWEEVKAKVSGSRLMAGSVYWSQTFPEASSLFSQHTHMHTYAHTHAHKLLASWEMKMDDELFA